MRGFAWTVVGGAVILAVVWRPVPFHEPAAPSSTLDARPAHAASERRALPSKPVGVVDRAPAARAVPDERLQGTTAASMRTKVYDAPKVLRAVESALATGTPDEKGWAAEVFRACFSFWPNKKFDAVSSPDAAVAALQQEAFKSLIARCDGVYVTGWADRKEMLAPLTSAAESSTTPYRTLKVLQKRHDSGDARWQPAEADLLETALYGADPLLRREAFFVLLAAIDRNAPGGEDRGAALLGSMTAQVVNPPLSEFERLLQCYLVGMCRGESILPTYHFPSFEPRPEPGASTVLRLQALYQDAFSRRLAPADILAIR